MRKRGRRPESLEMKSVNGMKLFINNRKIMLLSKDNFVAHPELTYIRDIELSCLLAELRLHPNLLTIDQLVIKYFKSPFRRLLVCNPSVREKI